MAYKLSMIFALMAMLFLSTSASAGMFDFMKQDETSLGGQKELSDCGRSVETYRKFMHDAKICKKDDDCVSVPGICPLGCKIFVNKIFEGILTKKMNEVSEMCSDSVCSYKCTPELEKTVCVENHCVEKR